MKLILITMFALIFVCGCNSKMDLHEKVRAKFPNAEIAILPSNRPGSLFIIRSSNEIWYAEENGVEQITCTKIFSAKPE